MVPGRPHHRPQPTEEIRQLVAKYSLTLDVRDLNAPVDLFAPDKQVSHNKVGCHHLKRWLDDTRRLQFTGTSNHIANHIIEFDDVDHAQDSLLLVCHGPQ